jgi:hypothetical protein
MVAGATTVFRLGNLCPRSAPGGSASARWAVRLARARDEGVNDAKALPGPKTHVG